MITFRRNFNIRRNLLNRMQHKMLRKSLVTRNGTRKEVRRIPYRMLQSMTIKTLRRSLHESLIRNNQVLLKRSIIRNLREILIRNNQALLERSTIKSLHESLIQNNRVLPKRNIVTRSLLNRKFHQLATIGQLRSTTNRLKSLHRISAGRSLINITKRAEFKKS